MPLAVVAMTSFSIVARISAPTDSSVMPSESSILQLALGGGAAVAPHRRHDERLGAEVAQPVDRAARQLDALAEPPAARADGDGHAGRDRRREAFDDGRSGRRLDVGDRRAATARRARPRAVSGS